MDTSRRQLLLGLEKNGISFQRKKWFRLPFTSTHKEIDADKFADRLESGEKLDHLAIKLRDVLVPLQSDQDLYELAELEGDGSPVELERPQLAEQLKQLAEHGFRFSATVGQDGPTATGLYVAYNALSDPAHNLTAPVATLEQGRQIRDLDPLTLGRISDFYSHPDNQEWVEIEKSGWTFRNADQQDICAAQLEMDGFLNRGNTTVELSELPAGKRLEFLEKLETYNKSVSAFQALKLLQTVRDNPSLERLHQVGHEESFNIPKRQRASFQRLLLRELESFPETRETSRWLGEIVDQLDGDTRLKAMEPFFATPIPDKKELAEALTDLSYRPVLEGCAQVLKAESENTVALEWGLEMADGLADYDAAQLLEAALQQRTASSPEELTALGKTFHERVDASGEKALQKLLEFSETRGNTQKALEMADKHSEQTTKQAIFKATWAQANLDTGAGWGAFGAAVMANLDTYYGRDQRAAVGAELLEKLKEFPSTKTAAEFGERLSAESGNKVEIMNWVLENPTAQSPKELAAFGQNADAANGMRLLSELENHPQTAELATWARTLNEQLGSKSKRAVTALVTEHLGTPADHVARLMELQNTKGTDVSDALAISDTALALLDQKKPALVMARELTPKLDSYGKLALNRVVYDGLSATKPEELRQLAEDIRDGLHSSKVAAGETLLTHLSQFPATAEASKYGLALAEKFENANVKNAIYDVLLGNPRVGSGEEKAQVGSSILGKMDGHYTRSYRTSVGEHFLEEMTADPRTESASAAATRMLAESKNPLQIIQWTLNNPTANSAQDFAAFGANADADANNGKLLLAELERYPETTELAGWQRSSTASSKVTTGNEG